MLRAITRSTVRDGRRVGERQREEAGEPYWRPRRHSAPRSPRARSPVRCVSSSCPILLALPFHRRASDAGRYLRDRRGAPGVASSPHPVAVVPHGLRAARRAGNTSARRTRALLGMNAFNRWWGLAGGALLGRARHGDALAARRRARGERGRRDRSRSACSSARRSRSSASCSAIVVEARRRDRRARR